MSKTAKIVLWIVVVIIVIGGIWWWIAQTGNPAPAPSTQTSGTPSADNQNVATGTSLDTDLSNIDAQMNGLSSDTASVDAGLNDQPISQ